ncbi:MAG TPA: DUF6069 family protein [Microlunatus sp.]|nr:DUF6069 family protein [Microlunatus sp.]
MTATAGPSAGTRTVQPSAASRRRRWLVTPIAVAAAALVNLVIFGIGRLAGASFAFTATGIGTTTVEPLTVVGFTAIPLGLGLLLVTLLAPVGRWVVTAASIVAPALAVITIVTMTLPADLDRASTVTLAACHLALAPISVWAVRRIGSLTVRTR